MNFTRISMLFLGAFLIAFTGCKPAPSTDAPNGDLTVQIPFAESTDGASYYQLKTVVLKEVSTLREVRGKFAQFFYAPGLTEGRLSGGSPAAYFAKGVNDTYLPKDALSLQMATLYYHMQSLITWAQDLGVSVKGPMQVGLNTKIKGDESIQSNNAFFDGRSKAMLFVPYTAKEMPIAVNAGIIAHEFFHSIFYSKVLDPLNKKRLSISQRLSDENVHSLEGWTEHKKIAVNLLTEVELFNETYLRGVNEGLADFWGWAYTNDPDFLKWSLSAHVKKRSLNKPSVVTYKTDRDIENAVLEANTMTEDPSLALSNFVYEIGTPYARFLKELVSVKAKNDGLSISDAIKEVSQFVISFIEHLGTEAYALQKNDKLSSQALFFAAAQSSSRQSLEQCELIIQYLNSPLEKESVIAAKYTCEKDENVDAYKVVAP